MQVNYILIAVQYCTQRLGYGCIGYLGHIIYKHIHLIFNQYLLKQNFQNYNPHYVLKSVILTITSIVLCLPLLCILLS